MATTLFQRLALVTTSTALSLTAISPSPATAFYFNLYLTITYDPYALLEVPISGTFSLDSSSIRDLGVIGYGFGESTEDYPDLETCYSFQPICFSQGSLAKVTDFQVNFLGKIFTQNTAKSFNFTYVTDYFYIGHYIRFPSLYTGLIGEATWDNPSLVFGITSTSQLPEQRETKSSFAGYFKTNLPNPYQSTTGFNFFDLSASDYNPGDTEPTPVPEGKTELAILGLGLLGFAKFLKKKINSSQHS